MEEKSIKKKIIVSIISSTLIIAAGITCAYFLIIKNNTVIKDDDESSKIYDSTNFNNESQKNNVEENNTSSNKSNITLVSGDKDTIGSEIAIGDEHFYVISSDDESVTMLAKYNLLVGQVHDSSFNLISTYTGTEEGYGLQSESAKGYVKGLNKYIGIVAFTNDQDKSHGYWLDDHYYLLSKYGTDCPAYVYDDNSPIKKYVDNYKLLIENKYDLTISEARLVKYEEIENLGCDFYNRTCSSAPSWVYQTSYWTGTCEDNSIRVVISEGFPTAFNFAYDEYVGVRPVITISKSEF